MTVDRETGKTWPITEDCTDHSDNSVYGLSDLDCTSLSNKNSVWLARCMEMRDELMFRVDKIKFKYIHPRSS